MWFYLMLKKIELKYSIMEKTPKKIQIYCHFFKQRRKKKKSDKSKEKKIKRENNMKFF